MTNPASAESSGRLKLLFMDKADICDPRGKLSFGANPLQFVDKARGLPTMVVREVIKEEDGGFLLYGYQSAHNLKDMTWRIIRCRTYDGITFHDAETVYISERGHWYGSTEIVYNPMESYFLCLKWAPGQIEGGHAMWAFGSEDGTTWRQLASKPVYHDHDSFGAMWDPRAQEYVVFQATYQRHLKWFPDNAGPDIRRVLHIRTSKDGIHWTPPEDVTRKGYLIPEERLITPDENDPPELEFYRFTGFPYHDRYVGMMLNYFPSPACVQGGTGHGPHNGGEWWISRDGRRWQRPFRDIFAPGPADNIIMHPPITVNGWHLWVIGNDVFGVPEDRIFHVGSLSNCEFSTLPFEMPSSPLILNASISQPGRGFQGQGYIMVEVLDEVGNVIPGAEREKCIFRSIERRPILRWSDQHTAWALGSLRGKKIRLRFYLRDARIYSVTTAT